MYNYQTVEEKAAEWNVSIRHVQYLCKLGKIEGVIKKAGAWFIPENAPIPVKNTKSGVQHFKFVGTKKKIFDNAIRLFMEHTFDGVSMRCIADSVGIKQSAMYNHFKSKQEILDTIYDYYCHYYTLNRPTLEGMDLTLRNGNLLEIINCLAYEFDDEYKQKLSDISKIVFHRCSIDERANGVAKKLLVEEGTAFVEAAFSRLVEIGRLMPTDVHSLSILINSIRIYTFFNWIIDDSDHYMAPVITDEQVLYEYISVALENLWPSGTGAPTSAL